MPGGAPKVPAVAPYFWVVKLLTTAMGEALSDFVVLDVNKYLGVVLGFAVFVIAIVWQFRAPHYRTWPYWTAVSMVAVFGTMAADVMHVVLGVPYMASALFYAVCLIVTFAIWYRAEGTLDIHSIVTRRREVCYWLAVIFTFAMGTALGDLFATTFRLGYLASAFVFTVAICVPLIAWRLGASPVLTFWVAYILTRPIGASFADFFGMPKAISGMGYGHGAVSVVTLILVVAFIIYLARSGIDQPEEASFAGDAAAGYGRPQYAQVPYSRSEYGQPRSYDGPRQEYYGDSRREYYDDPRQAYYDDRPRGEPRYGRSQYEDPRYAGRGQGDPRYAADPRYRDPADAGRQGRSRDPRESDPRGRDRRYRNEERPYGDPRYGDQQQRDRRYRDRDPRDGDRRSRDPRGGDRRSRDPRESDPRYSDPRGTDRRYRNEERPYGDPRYGDQQQRDRRYRDRDPRGGDRRSRDRQVRDPRYRDPRERDRRYRDPRYEDPEYRDPRYEDPPYGDRRDYR